MNENAQNIDDKNGIKKVKEAGSTLYQDVTNLGKVALEAAGSTVDQAQKKVSEIYQDEQKKVEAVGREVEGYLKKYPIQALAASVGVGFLLGWMMKNRKKNSDGAQACDK